MHSKYGLSVTEWYQPIGPFVFMTQDTTTLEDRIARLEGIIEDQQAVIEKLEERDQRQQEIIERLEDTEETRESEGTEGSEGPVGSESDTGGGGGSRGRLPSPGRRGALQALGLAGLAGIGATTVTGQSSPQGSIGTANRPLETVFTQSIDGGVTGNTPVENLAGQGLAISGNALTVGSGGWQKIPGPVEGEQLLEPRAADVDGVDLNLVRTEEPVMEFTMGVYHSPIEVARFVEGFDGSQPATNITFGWRHALETDYGATISGGRDNGVSGQYGIVGGGYLNTANATYATVGGGQNNSVEGPQSTIGGGVDNSIANADTTVGGGNNNNARGQGSTISGGVGNVTTEPAANSTVAGGIENVTAGSQAAVGGGRANVGSGEFATVSGGQGNRAAGAHAAVPGGRDNEAVEQYALAAGRAATANEPGSFVVGDSSDARTRSQRPDEARFQTSITAEDVVRFENQRDGTDIEMIQETAGPVANGVIDYDDTVPEWVAVNTVNVNNVSGEDAQLATIELDIGAINVAEELMTSATAWDQPNYTDVISAKTINLDPPRIQLNHNFDTLRKQVQFVVHQLPQQTE